MPTFKAVIRKDHQRKDGKFLVLIRITQGKQSVYSKTGLYVSKKQIHGKTGEIKDQFVLERTNKTIREYEQALLSISTRELMSMPAADIKRFLEVTDVGDIDYLAYCHNLIEKEKTTRRQILACAIVIIERDMSITNLPIIQFTSTFLKRYKETMDSSDRSMKNSTKNLYLSKLIAVFNQIKEEYNTDFVQVIKHNPTVGFEYYPKEDTVRRSMDVTVLRKIFNQTGLSRIVQSRLDICKLMFCLCGINTKDLATMKKSCYDRKTNRITYNRSKTKEARADNARSSIRIEPEIQDIFEKHLAKDGDLLFSFCHSADEVEYRNLKFSLTRSLRIACNKCGIQENITPYWFRHTWATIARNKCNISKDDIDLCLNHVGNNPMADVYIDEDWSRIDAANRKVLDFVFHSDKE